MLHRLVRTTRSVVRAVRRKLTALADLVTSVWSRHRRLLADNPGYVTAVAAGAATIVGQGNPWDLLATITATVLGVYATTRRGITSR